MKYLRTIAASLILGALTTACGDGLSKTGNLKLPDIDAASTFEYATQICKTGPRPSGSANSQKNISYICSVLDKLGAPYELDTWAEDTPAGKINFSNLLVEIKGKKKDFILVASHHDTKVLETVPDFQGVNDGASANAALLGMIQAVIKAGSRLEHTLLFAFLDGEECRFQYSDSDGLHGSKRLAAKFAKDRSRKCVAAIILDMVGDKDLQIAIPSDSDPALAEILFDIAKEKGLEKYFTWNKTPILDDHVPFQKLGIPAINLIDFSFGPSNLYWHSPEDKLENISPESIAIVANVALGMIVKLQNKNSLKSNE